MKTTPTPLRELSEDFATQEELLRRGGSVAGEERQRALGRLTARERIAQLLDNPATFFELGLWAAYGMYEEWGEVPAAGIIAGIGTVCDRPCMLVANDAAVKAGAFFPQTVKKTLRAQRIAYQCRLPILYLVDSSGVFLPLQDEIFPDEDDFGRIFRNNAVLSASGIPQIAAVMGSCIAGGGYLPVLCDQLLMTRGSGLYLAGPALVKAAIGQEVDAESLGGAAMHAEISGTVDFLEPDDVTCLQRMRALVALLPAPSTVPEKAITPPDAPPETVYDLVSADGSREYDMRALLATVVDGHSFEESKARYGQSLITAYARVGGFPVGIVANQRIRTQPKVGGLEIGGVIYTESADKAARFVMDCNQAQIPILFFQDVMGFMVGKEAEQSGIIRSGAKLVNAVSNSVVPKITVIVGNSFGAGHYALCGKAYDPAFILAWPSARYAVMGADQAADTLFAVQKRAAERQGKALNAQELAAMRQRLADRYRLQTDIRYAAARGWVDAIIQPSDTRKHLIALLSYVKRATPSAVQFHTGVLQV
jgi:3-methylcrotonyl-CoA carboxylase beta subunit